MAGCPAPCWKLSHGTAGLGRLHRLALARHAQPRTLTQLDGPQARPVPSLLSPALARASRAAGPVTHWDQDQMQSATSIPAIASASTACAAVTPHPH
jgi:hypothetical protein